MLVICMTELRGRPATTRQAILDYLEEADDWVNYRDILANVDGGDVPSALYRMRQERRVEWERLPQWGSGTKYRLKDTTRHRPEYSLRRRHGKSI